MVPHKINIVTCCFQGYIIHISNLKNIHDLAASLVDVVELGWEVVRKKSFQLNYLIGCEVLSVVNIYNLVVDISLFHCDSSLRVLVLIWFTMVRSIQYNMFLICSIGLDFHIFIIIAVMTEVMVFRDSASPCRDKVVVGFFVE